MRNAFNILDGNSEVKRRKWRLEDNIRMGLREVGWEGVDCVHLSQDRYQSRALVNAVMNLRVP
jgi:hypothetical protein